MPQPLLEDVEEEVNKQLAMIEDLFYNKSKPWMTSSLTYSEIQWIRRMLLYLRYVKERDIMPKEALIKYYKSIKDLLWLYVNQDRKGRIEGENFMAGIREQITAMKGGIHKWFGGGSEEKR